MAADTLALSLYRLVTPTVTGRDLAARLVGLLAALGITAHLDTPVEVLDRAAGAPASGPHVLAHGDLAVIVWPIRGAALGLPINSADRMLDALQDLLEEIGVYPPGDGTPRFHIYRPETCELEALVVADAGKVTG